MNLDIEEVLLRAERHKAFTQWREKILRPVERPEIICSINKCSKCCRFPKPGAPPSVKCNRIEVSE